MGDGMSHGRRMANDWDWYENAIENEMVDFILLVKEDTASWGKKELLDRLTDLCSHIEIQNFTTYSTNGNTKVYRIFIRVNGASKQFETDSLNKSLQASLLFAEFMCTERGKEIHKEYMEM